MFCLHVLYLTSNHLSCILSITYNKGKATARTLSMLKVKSIKQIQFAIMSETASILNANEALIKFIPVAAT